MLTKIDDFLYVDLEKVVRVSLSRTKTFWSKKQNNWLYGMKFRNKNWYHGDKYIAEAAEYKDPVGFWEVDYILVEKEYSRWFATKEEAQEFANAFLQRSEQEDKSLK